MEYEDRVFKIDYDSQLKWQEDINALQKQLNSYYISFIRSNTENNTICVQRILILYDYLIYDTNTKIINIVSRYFELDDSITEYFTTDKNVFEHVYRRCQSKEKRGIYLLKFRDHLAEIMEEFIHTHSTDITGNTCIQNLNIDCEYDRDNGNSNFIVTAKFPLQSNLTKLVKIIPTNVNLY
jgi:hypothetical protein